MQRAKSGLLIDLLRCASRQRRVAVTLDGGG
jgi:hypothetical protein